jgi:hypothetical protein
MNLKTNGGDFVTEMKTKIKDFGEVWFNPNAITNILAWQN